MSSSAIEGASDGTKAPRKWSFPAANRSWRGRSGRREGRFSKSSADAGVNPFVSPFIDPVVAGDLQQLRKYTLKIRNATKDVHHVDSAWDEYVKHKEKCLEWSTALVHLPRNGEVVVFSPAACSSEFRGDLPVDGLDFVSADADSVVSPLHFGARDEQCQEAVLEWESAVEHLENTLRTSLQDTYNEYNKDATPEGFERICANKDARRTTIYRMRNASISKLMSADLDFFPKYDVRFRNYDEITKDLARVRLLLGTAIPQDRTIIERRISPTGDAILEFANMKSRKHPVFRFRVASHCLRETSSPIFRHMFNARFRAELDDDMRRSLPLPPTRHECSDGSIVMLYRMPQTEHNFLRSFETLLHAAHNHSDRVPREIPFHKFVAIAETCQRYWCTSPLELAVGHLWLPQWRDKVTDNMLEGALLISYVFGLSENFTRLSRIAILNSTGARYKPWPRRVQEKIAAARREKMERISQQCKTTLNEYLCAPARADSQTSALRCARGESICDAQNLGWFMQWLTKAGLLTTTSGTAPSFLNIQVPQNQSLAEIISALRQITSPPQCHGGACDLATRFRVAINDVYESVSGLTLFEVSGKYGWALSKNRSPRHSAHDPLPSPGGLGEMLFEIATRDSVGLGDYPGHGLRDPGFLGCGDGEDSGAGNEEDDACFFRVLGLLEEPRDLRSGALVNERSFRTDLSHEERLWEGLGSVGNGNVVEADTIPSRIGRGANGPREKFRPGELLLGDREQRMESDGSKCLGDAREQLLGLKRA